MKFSGHACKEFYQKTQFQNSQRIIKAIEKLAEDPFLMMPRIYGTSKKLFRIRVGDFRILYRIDYEEIIVIIVSVDSRKRVY